MLNQKTIRGLGMISLAAGALFLAGCHGHGKKMAESCCGCSTSDCKEIVAGEKKDCGKACDDSAKSKNMTAYGQEMKYPHAAPVAVSAVLADPSKYEGKTLLISGSVKEVCEAKGCWMSLSDPKTNEALFVKFVCPIDDKRLIPLEAIGKPALVEGEVLVKMIDEDEAKHYAAEAGKSAEELEKIKGPQKQVTIESPAAKVALAE